MDIFGTLTIDRWIAIASSIGTLIAAGLAAFNIRELRLQRAQQFQPRIMPTQVSYSLRVYPEDLLDFERQAEKIVPIINVGHGVATDIHVGWRVRTDEWMDKVNKLSALRGAGVGAKRDQFGLSLLYNGKAKGGARLPELETRDLPYLLPVSADREASKIPLPGAVTALLHAFYWSYFRGVGQVEGVYRSPDTEFSLEMMISYKDTVGRAYSQTSELSFCMLMEAERGEDDETPMPLMVIVEPVRTEPAEGYSIIIRTLLRAARMGADRLIGI